MRWLLAWPWMTPLRGQKALTAECAEDAEQSGLLCELKPESKRLRRRGHSKGPSCSSHYAHVGLYGENDTVVAWGRWVVERTFACLSQFLQLRLR